MKTIIYIFITLFVSNILISAIPKTGLSNRQNIKLQCVGTCPDVDELNKSANIMASRLIDYGVQDADVVVDAQMPCIDISMPQSADVRHIAPLLTSKGSVEFYETLDRLEIINEPSVHKDLASVLNIPDDDEGFDRFSGIYGYCKADKKSAVEFYLEKPEMERGINFHWSAQPNNQGDIYLFILSDKVLLDNSNIAGTVVKNGASGPSALMVTFDASGKSIWQEATKRNKGKAIAIVLDGKVLQAPLVKSEILGGKCLLTGNFSPEEINQMHALMNNDVLPVEFTLKH